MKGINETVTAAKTVDNLESVNSDAKKLIELILDMSDADVKKILFLVEGVRIGETSSNLTT